MFASMSSSDRADGAHSLNTPENFKRVLDAGAWGVVVLMVNSREEAERAVQAARYYPDGNCSRRRRPPCPELGFFRAEYYRNANEQVLLVLQIEHIDGVRNADEEILSVPGVDAWPAGPNDLAALMGLGLGVPLESDNPELVEATRHPRHLPEDGVATGIHTSGAEGVNFRIGQASTLRAMASELRYMLGFKKTSRRCSGRRRTATSSLMSQPPRREPRFATRMHR